MITLPGIYQIILYLVVLLLLVKPVGWYMTRVFEGNNCGLTVILRPLERFIYRICQIDSNKEMTWKTYLIAMLVFNLFGIFLVYAILRLQYYLPLNPLGLSAIAPDLAFNTAISFATNTNWQAYSGETSMSYFSQSIALTVQNFISAATGLSLLMAIIRGIARQESHTLGNFWVDTIRSVLYIFMPLSIIFAIFLTSQGVIQNYQPNQSITLIQPYTYQNNADAIQVTEQVIPMGPVASQIAIKQLGTNGGGFFNTNSAHPFENPTPLTNFFELLAILLIPSALCYTYGMMVKDKRQGWALLAAMIILFLPFVTLCTIAEQIGNPALTKMGGDQAYHAQLSSGGNMEGKEVRFGIASSAIWATATSATSNGSVNAMLDSFTPLGGFVPLWMMHLGEMVFGGIGSGLYSMLMFVFVAVFVAGLMVGRTPEYLGKKIEPYEMKMASIAILVMPLIVLVMTAIGVVTSIGLASISNPGPHGFTEILYAFTSMGNNNGSAFAGLNADTPFYNITGGITMLIIRYWIAISAVAIAGSLASKKIIPSSLGTLPTHTPLFIILLMSIALIFGALSFLPTLALGPVVEHLTLWEHYGH